MLNKKIDGIELSVHPLARVYGVHIISGGECLAVIMKDIPEVSFLHKLAKGECQEKVAFAGIEYELDEKLYECLLEDLKG